MPKDIEDRAEANSMLDASARPGLLKPVRLVIVDRQPILLQGLKSVLATQQDFDVVAASLDGQSCLDAIRTLTPDVALIADTLPDLTAAEMLAIATAEKLSTRLVFFTDPEIAPELAGAVSAGACSAISKYVAPADMLHALRLMTKSGVSLQPRDLSPKPDEADGGKIEKLLELLTDRERQIARLVSEGLSNKEIARKLNVSQGTVKVHLYNIFQKLEITNRTVLATIALLQRTSAFGALALAFLAFAVADELKASETSDVFPSADDAGHAGEHPGYEVWKKAILQRLMVSDGSETPGFDERDFLAKVGEVTNPAAAIEALRVAEQFMGAKPWKDYAPVGSITPSSAALLPQRVSDARIESELFPEHQFPRLAAHLTADSGYATFAALAGALIYALSESQAAAKALDPAHATIDSALAGLGENATAKLAAITHVEAHQADKAAAEFLSPDVGLHSVSAITANRLAQEGIQIHAGPDAAGPNLQKAGLLDSGRDAELAGLSRDQLIGGNSEDFIFRAPSDSRSSPPDSVVDLASGPGRLNLGAFGALAWLHLTAAAKSIPPHTLAWVYDSATNETIVYVNPTDRVLEVGDRGVMEIHLKGIVSIAESDVVQVEDAAVAVTLEQLEQALMPTAIADVSGLGAGSVHAEESSTEAGIWGSLADDGMGFRFTQVRTGFATSAQSTAFTSEARDTTAESMGASSLSVQASSTPPGQSAAIPLVEKLSPKSEPMSSNNGAPPTQQTEWVPPGLAMAEGTGHGNSDHASEPGSSETAPQSTESGNGGKAGEHPAPASKAAREAAAEKAAERGDGDAGHDQHPGSADDPATAPTADSAGRGHAHHASEQEAAKGAPEPSKPGNGVEHQGPAPKEGGESAAEKTSDPVDHGRSGHDRHPNAPAADVVTDNAEGNHSGPAEDAAEPRHLGKGAEHKGAAPKDGWELPAEKTLEQADHDHSGPDDHPSSATAPTADATVDAGNHSPHASEPGAAKAAGKEAAEISPDNNIDKGKEPHSPGSDDPRSAEAEAKNDGEHGNAPPAGGGKAQQAHSGAEIAKAAELPSETAPDAVFRFEGEAAPVKLAIVEPGAPDHLQIAHGPDDELKTIVETIPHAVNEHAAQHGHDGPHHGMSAGSSDWLI